MKHLVPIFFVQYLHPQPVYYAFLLVLCASVLHNAFLYLLHYILSTTHSQIALETSCS